MSNTRPNAGSPFVLPSMWNFPPFFTIQPVADTRKKQLQMWVDLILGYCRAHTIFEVDANDSSFPLWHNEKIKRKLSNEGIRAVLEEIVSQGNGEWADREKSKVLLLWKKPEEWATILSKWVHDNGLRDSIFTLYELRQGDTAAGEEFHGLDQRILLRALQILERQGKAQIFSASTGDPGVKFLNT